MLIWHSWYVYESHNSALGSEQTQSKRPEIAMKRWQNPTDKLNSEVVSISIMVFIPTVSAGISFYRCFVLWPGGDQSLPLQSPSLRLPLPLRSSLRLVFVICKWFFPKVIIVWHCLSNRLLSVSCQGSYSICLWPNNICPKFVQAAWWEMILGIPRFAFVCQCSVVFVFSTSVICLPLFCLYEST